MPMPVRRRPCRASSGDRGPGKQRRMSVATRDWSLESARVRMLRTWDLRAAGLAGLYFTCWLARRCESAEGSNTTQSKIFQPKQPNMKGSLVTGSNRVMASSCPFQDTMANGDVSTPGSSAWAYNLVTIM